MEKKDVKFEMSTGMAHKLAMAFGRNGWSLAEVDKLCDGDTLKELRGVIGGWSKIAPNQFPSSAAIEYAVAEFYRQTCINLQIVEDKEASERPINDWVAEKLPVKRGEEDTITIRTVRARAKMAKLDYSAADAVRMHSFQSSMSKTFDRAKSILFTGTRFVDTESEEQYIVCLDHSKSMGWHLEFMKVGEDVLGVKRASQLCLPCPVDE